MTQTGAAAMQEAAERFACLRDPQALEALCEAAMPLLRRIAAGVAAKLPRHIGIDDLIGDGALGLLRAAERYEPEHGIPFDAWAIRIVRGAMLNGLRRMDVLPERLRRSARRLEASRWRLAQAHGTSPSDGVAAAGAGLPAEKLDTVLIAVRRAAHVSLDAPSPAAFGPESPLRDRMPASDASPADIAAEREARRMVGSAVTSLPPRERAIVRGFYAHGTSFRAIGSVLGISKQRVAQLHARALVDLRHMLAPHFADA